jgi:hypothetical protein
MLSLFYLKLPQIIFLFVWLERHAAPSALHAEHAFNPDPSADMRAMRGLLTELAGLMGRVND